MRPQADDQLPEKRIDPPTAADEKATLLAFLDYQRQTLLLKCAGLSPEQLLARSVPPSSLCLLGLVRHLTEVEFGWLHVRFAGEPDREIYGPGDADLEVSEADAQSVAEAFGRYAEFVARSQQIVAGADLSQLTCTPHQRTGEHFSLRWILDHLLEEYARHNGHADLLREAIDGTVGE
ncbi:MAG TPA: DinB family protein [Jatrophihabitans sp.]|nr:DinB family protein [Jatrophihabitans sp.]